MRLNKEDFCFYVNKYKNFYKMFEELDSFLGSNVFETRLYEPMNILYTLINDLCDFSEQDNEVGTWLDYWVFECDFGKVRRPIIYDNKTLFIETPEQLYDFIIDIQQ